MISFSPPPGAGTGGISTLPDAAVAYIRAGATGGTIGDAADPFADIDTARGAMSASPFLFDLDDGTHALALDYTDIDNTDLYYFRGSGPGTVVNITVTPNSDGVSDATPTAGSATNFGTGSPFTIQSDHSCTINILCTGSTGGSFDDGGGGAGNGATGGAIGGRLHIKNAIVSLNGIDGGAGGAAGAGGGSAGATGAVSFTNLTTINCQVTDDHSPTIVTSSLDSLIGTTAANQVLTLPASAIASGTLSAARGGTGVSNDFNLTIPATGTAALLGTANTFTALQTITQATTNTGVLASTGYSLTGSNATSQVNLAGTWNTSGTPTLLKFSVTETARASGSTAATACNYFQILGGATGTDNRVQFFNNSATNTNPEVCMKLGSGGFEAILKGGTGVAMGLFQVARTDIPGASYACFGNTGSVIGIGVPSDGVFSFGNTAGGAGNITLLNAAATACCLSKGGTGAMWIGSHHGTTWGNQSFGAAGAVVGTTSNGSPTNTFTLHGAVSTGTGSGGAIRIATYGTNGASGTAIGTLTTRIECNVTGIGFFGASPVAKPTGVAVDAAGIHAALVSLGLIAA